MKRLYRLGLGMVFIMTSVALANEGFVLEYFSTFSSMKADFKQVVSTQKRDDVSSGHLLVRKKNARNTSAGFYFDYTTPYQQKIVSDGQRLWHYDVDLMQVVIKRLGDFEKSSPVFILFGDQPLNSFFSIKELQKERKYLLTPKNRDLQVELASVELQFNKGALSAITALEATGQKIAITLTNVRANSPLTDADFKLNIPKGVDIIDESK